MLNSEFYLLVVVPIVHSFALAAFAAAISCSLAPESCDAGDAREIERRTSASVLWPNGVAVAVVKVTFFYVFWLTLRAGSHPRRSNRLARSSPAWLQQTGRGLNGSARIS